MKRRTLLATTVALASWRLPARAEELDTVTVGAILLPTNAPLFIAMDKGYFARERIKVALIWFTAASSVFSAVVSQDVDVGVTSATAATYNLASKGGFKIIGGTTRDAPQFPLNGVVVSNKAWDAGFTSLDKMGGRRFAMTTAGSSHHYYIGTMAKKHGVALASIQLVPLESYGNITAALQTGQVDAAVLPPVLVARMVDAKTAHFLAWTGDEVPEQQGIVCASPQTIARKHELMVRFMRAYVAGAAEYNAMFNQLGADGHPVKGPGSAPLIEIIARGANVKPAEAEAQVAYIIPDLRPDEADFNRQIAFWQENGLVSKNADFKNLFDLSLLPAKPD